MRKTRKRKNMKKIITVIISFMFLFSIGFVAGTKLLNKSNSTENNTLAKDNQAIQGNKDSVTKGVDNAGQVATPDKSQTSTSENTNTNTTTTKPASETTTSTNTSGDSATKKEAFLTFDDGPTTNITPQILKILDDYNIKATFFVVGQNAEKHPELVREEKDKGHSIENHTYSHDYKYIYASTSNFIKDVEKNNQVLTSILGEYDSKIIRFPGGSFGSKRAPYREAVKKAGYTYVDWNALNGDAEALNVPADKLLANIKSTVTNQNHLVILMHDSSTKQTTVEALPKIIDYLKSKGYVFKAM